MPQDEDTIEGLTSAQINTMAASLYDSLVISVPYPVLAVLALYFIRHSIPILIENGRLLDANALLQAMGDDVTAGKTHIIAQMRGPNDSIN